MIAQSEEGAGTDWTSNIGDQSERERDVSDPGLQSLQGRHQTCHTHHTIVPLVTALLYKIPT